jgi:hypothetical protein
MKKPFYELAIFGDPAPGIVAQIEADLAERLSELGLAFPGDVTLYVGAASEFKRSTDRCGAALCFPLKDDQERHIVSLMKRGLAVIPVAQTKDELGKVFGEKIGALNGIGIADVGIDGIVLALLECASLLPRQRRVFLSYRRTESTEAALQLYAELSGRLFDVFLDTHDIHPGKHFQEVLWQRLCDCDVMLFLDTEKYFESRWTEAEFGRANWRGIPLVRASWPEVKLNKRARLATSVKLTKADFEAGGLSLTQGSLDRICEAVENARTRSVASRFAQLTATLKASVERGGGKIEGISLRRSLIVKTPNGRSIAVYPSLGVPTSYTLFDATRDEHTPPVAVVYDDGGIDERDWKAHMEWISEHVKGSVRLVSSYRAGWDFNDWK